MFISKGLLSVAPKEICIFPRKHNTNQLQNIVSSLVGLENEKHDLEILNRWDKDFLRTAAHQIPRFLPQLIPYSLKHEHLGQRDRYQPYYIAICIMM